MTLRNNIYKIANQHHIAIEPRAVFSLKKFINELDTEPKRAHDFQEMVEKIKTTYTRKSYKSEMFFIQNIAHTTKRDTKEHLFDFKHLDLSRNFNTSITEYSLHNFKNILANENINEDKIIKASNNLHTYIHKNNTLFIEQMDAKYSFKKLAKVKYIDLKNKSKKPIMLTFTLDNAYRKYIKDGETVLGEFQGLKEINKYANLELLIENSYHKLNETFRKFYLAIKKLNERSNENDKLDFIMIFEPHKSLTLHLHVLFYCNDVQKENLDRAWENYIKGLSIKQRKGQDKKIIDTTQANASTYLSKYLIKEYNTDTKESSFFIQFKRYFSKFKLFRTSNFYHTTQAKIDKMYNFLSAQYPDILEHMKLSDTPIYEILEQFEIQGLFRFEKEKVQSLSFDRKRMKEFYQKLIALHKDDIDIKNEIKNKIECYTSIKRISRIKSAIFILDCEAMNTIFDKYDIERVESDFEEKLKNIFYTSGMYKMVNFQYNEAISIAATIAMSA